MKTTPPPERQASMAFPGFPPRVRYTPVPSPLLGPLLQEIDDLAELKCTLRILWLLHQKKGYPRFVTLKEVLADQVLCRALGQPNQNVADRIRQAVGRAVERGILIHATVPRVGVPEDVYLVNGESERRALGRMGQRELEPGPRPLMEPEPLQWTKERPNIFALYEDNIGLVTPMIAEELKQAEELYPQEWIEDAFKEAVSRNRRSWRYIARILERWEQEGRDDGEHGEPWGHIKKTDPKEYLRL